MELALATIRQKHIVYDLLVAAIQAEGQGGKAAHERVQARMREDMLPLLDRSPLYGFCVLAGDTCNQKAGANYELTTGLQATIYGMITVRRVRDHSGNVACEFQGLYVVPGSPRETASTLMVHAAETAQQLFPDAPEIWLGTWNRPGHWRALGFQCIGRTKEQGIVMKAPIAAALEKARALKERTLALI